MLAAHFKKLLFNGFAAAILLTPAQGGVSPTPTVRIKSPGRSASAAGGTTTVTVRGTAKDDVAVTRVTIEVPGLAPIDATLTGADPHNVEWEAVVPVDTGANTVQVTAFDADANTSRVAVRKFTFIKYCQITVVPKAGGVVNRRSGRMRVGRTVRFSARSIGGYLFEKWLLDGAMLSSARTVDLTIPDVASATIIGSFVANPYTAQAGSYNDVLRTSASTAAGYYTARLNTAGSFTLSASVNGVAIRRKGFIELDGTCVLTVARRGQAPLTVTFVADLALDGIRLDVLDGNNSAHITAETQRYADPASLPARATIALPADSNFPVGLKGNGFITLERRSGAYRLNGTLADGESWSIAVYPIESGGATIPLYHRFRSGGMIDGALTWDAPMRELSGQVHWRSPALARYQIPSAIDGTLQAAGHIFTPPERGYVLAPLGSTASARFLIFTSTYGSYLDFNFSPSYAAISPPYSRFELRLSPTTGIFSGRFVFYGDGPPVMRSFKGVVVQQIYEGRVDDIYRTFGIGLGFSLRTGASDRAEMLLFTSP
jgi:hypothetical protein